MGDGISMSISIDNPSNETLNPGPLALLLQQQYEFPFGINIIIIMSFFSIFCLVFVSVYDLLTGKVVKSLDGCHRSCVRDISWHPYNNTIISSSVSICSYLSLCH